MKTTDRTRVTAFWEIRPYEPPQYLVEPLSGWLTPAVFGPGGFDESLIEVRVLDDAVRGWGPADAIIELWDHGTGVRGHYLAAYD